jgi:uncharacterized protein (DUF305 family)
MTRTTAQLGRLAGAPITGALVLAGCAGGSSDAADNARTSSDPSAGAEATFNDADVTFAQGMLPHHQQAIEMAQLADGRAADPRILDPAGRIEAAQAPEINTLTSGLADWGADDMSGMDHGRGDDMGGMMSEQDTTLLMNADGTEFDWMFLQQMIAHHRGAVDTAVTEAADGQNADAIAMAENIRDSQNAEIAEMQQLLRARRLSRRHGGAALPPRRAPPRPRVAARITPGMAHRQGQARARERDRPAAARARRSPSRLLAADSRGHPECAAPADIDPGGAAKLVDRRLRQLAAAAAARHPFARLGRPATAQQPHRRTATSCSTVGAPARPPSVR